jgi:DNA-binding transcriptional ArsR family regulator
VSEFARQVLVRVAFDEETLKLSSSCDFNADIADLHEFHVIPSLFNDRRIWSIYKTEQGTVIYLPYLESVISFTADEKKESGKQVAISIDPGLIFKALGDNTRYGIVKEISKKPRTSAQLARRLSVSKPTISHHVQTLRESGLISEEYTSSGVELSIRKEVIEELSHTLVADLFGDENR